MQWSVTAIISKNQMRNFFQIAFTIQKSCLPTTKIVSFVMTDNNNIAYIFKLSDSVDFSNNAGEADTNATSP